MVMFLPSAIVAQPGDGRVNAELKPGVGDRTGRSQTSQCLFVLYERSFAEAPEADRRPLAIQKRHRLRITQCFAQ